MIEVEKRPLLAAIKLVSGGMDRRSALPILDRMRVHANGALTFEGTDMDMSVAASVPYSGEETAPFMMGNHAVVQKIVGHSGAKVVRFTPVKGEETPSVNLEAGDLSAALWSLNADDFPELRGVSTEAFSATLGQQEIATITRVAKGMSTEETRYYLNGVYLESLDDWTLRAVATDGHRLFIADMKVPGASAKLPRGVIVPRKAVQFLITHFARCDAVTLRFGSALPDNGDPGAVDWAASVSSSRLEFRADVRDASVAVATKLIDGTYPEYRKVIPEKLDFGAVFELKALRRAVAALSFDYKPVLRIEFQGGSARFSSRIADVVAMASIDVTYKGKVRDGYEVGLNGRYLADALDGLRGDWVQFGLQDYSSGYASAPVTIDDPEGDTMRIIQMPMRV